MTHETGTCNYVVTWNVYFHVSGNELQGPQQLMSEHESELDAEYALVDAGYSRVPSNPTIWRGRNGYACAYITRQVMYDFT